MHDEADLKSAINFFCEEYRKSDIWCATESGRLVNQKSIELKREDLPGVYALFDKHGLIYIGKASFNRSATDRLREYFSDKAKKKEDGLGKYIEEAANKESGKSAIKYIVYLMNKERSFEAPALEEFLICTLRPRFNTVGRISAAYNDTIDKMKNHSSDRKMNL